MMVVGAIAAVIVRVVVVVVVVMVVVILLLFSDVFMVVRFTGRWGGGWCSSLLQSRFLVWAPTEPNLSHTELF
jgi:hypothetical protein